MKNKIRVVEIWIANWLPQIIKYVEWGGGLHPVGPWLPKRICSSIQQTMYLYNVSYYACRPKLLDFNGAL